MKKTAAYKQRRHSARKQRHEAKRRDKRKATKHTSKPKHNRRGPGMSIGQALALGALFQASMPGLNLLTERGGRTHERK